jgi:hypothetical protein
MRAVFRVELGNFKNGLGCEARLDIFSTTIELLLAAFRRYTRSRLGKPGRILAIHSQSENTDNPGPG